MRMLGRRLEGARDQGMSLVEVMVAFFILAIVTTGLGLIITNGLKTQALTERTDRITGITQVVMSKARQVDFAQLGYYTADGVTAGNVTVPVSPISAGAAGPSVTEARVILGASRPPGTAPFATPVQSISNDSGVNYRITTHVTWVPNPGGVGTPTAKRVTITTQYAPYPTALTGDCAQANTRCTTNSFIRTATASDMDPVTGTSPTSNCTPGAAIICEAYVRAGRVLDGATMISATDVPEQAAPVDLYVRTASTASAVTATWQWKDAAGTVVKTVNVPLTGGSDGTRWTAEVSPDASGATSAYKGDIRPGAADVKFTATIGSSPVTVVKPAFWSYAPANGADAINATVVSAANWCSPLGAAQPVTFAVQGHSIGFTENTQNPSAKDRVEVVFTTTTGGVTRTETVPATIVPGSVVAENQVQNDVVTGGWVDAQWTAVPPSTERCDNRSVSVVVYRAVDQTTTPIILPLPATTAVVPTMSAPTMTTSIDQATGAYTLTWTAPGGATGYTLEVAEETEAVVSVNTTALTYTGTLSPGQGLSARVKANTQWSSSPWSTAATARRLPGPAVVTAVRAANKATFSWPAVPYATSYIVDVSVDGAAAVRTTQTGLNFTRDIERGQTLYVNVWPVASGATAAGPGISSASAPLWETPTLLNGWVNYANGYANARYTRTSQGVVVLSGLVRAGAGQTAIFSLPPGYRPAGGRLVFEQAVATSSGARGGRVDVQPDGAVVFDVQQPAAGWATGGWVSLDGITFVASDAPYTRYGATFANGWTDYPAPWAPATWVKDGLGRVHTQGLITGGSTASQAAMFTMAGADVPQYLNLATYSARGAGHFSVTGNSVMAKGDVNVSSAWTSVNALFYSTTSTATWTALPMQNGWGWYGYSYQPPEYTKAADGIVTLRGLLRGGTATNGTVIATLPAGYRPSAVEIFDVASTDGNWGRVDVYPTGEVIVREYINPTWVGLESISFIAEQ